MSAELLQHVAQELNKIFNPHGRPFRTGWVLLQFGIGAPGISNYVSNCNREDMIKAMRECADRLEAKEDNVRYPHPDDEP